MEIGLCFKLCEKLLWSLPSCEACVGNAAEYGVSGTVHPMWQSSCDLIDSNHSLADGWALKGRVYKQANLNANVDLRA